jgi:hypothetical protein
MAQALSNFDRAGSVRRVLRRGDQHVCGLCRNEYGELTVAQACVVRCWSEFLGMNPVLRRNKGKLISYRCRFCARDYQDVDDATKCGHACREKLKAAFEVESMLTEEVGDIPTSPPKRVKPRLRMVYLQPPRILKKKAPESAAETHEADGHEGAAEAKAPESAAAPEAPAGSEAAPVAQATPAADDHAKEGEGKHDKKVKHA